MRIIHISEQDAAQVNALLRMHSDVRDTHVIEATTLMGRLMRDEPDAAADTIADLEEQIETFEDDRDNLSRIATIFA